MVPALELPHDGGIAAVQLLRKALVSVSSAPEVLGEDHQPGHLASLDVRRKHIVHAAHSDSGKAARADQPILGRFLDAHLLTTISEAITQIAARTYASWKPALPCA